MEYKKKYLNFPKKYQQNQNQEWLENSEAVTFTKIDTSKSKTCKKYRKQIFFFTCKKKRLQKSDSADRGHPFRNRPNMRNLRRMNAIHGI